MVSSNAEGIRKVIEDDGKYAFLMESASIQYKIERNCKLHQVGGNLDNKGYGIPMRLGSPYKDLIDGAIVKMQEDGHFFKLKNIWWKQKRGGGKCVGIKAGGTKALGIENVVGIFITTILGGMASALWAIIEFFIGTKKQANELGTTWWEEIKQEVKFALKCFGTTKVTHKLGIRINCPATTPQTIS